MTYITKVKSNLGNYPDIRVRNGLTSFKTGSAIQYQNLGLRQQDVYLERKKKSSYISISISLFLIFEFLPKIL